MQRNSSSACIIASVPTTTGKLRSFSHRIRVRRLEPGVLPDPHHRHPPAISRRPLPRMVLPTRGGVVDRELGDEQPSVGADDMGLGVPCIDPLGQLLPQVPLELEDMVRAAEGEDVHRVVVLRQRHDGNVGGHLSDREDGCSCWWGSSWLATTIRARAAPAASKDSAESTAPERTWIPCWCMLAAWAGSSTRTR